MAGLFDVPNTEPPVPALVPVADWSRVRILLDGEPLLAREGEIVVGTRRLDLRRGLLLSAWTHRTLAGTTIAPAPPGPYHQLRKTVIRQTPAAMIMIPTTQEVSAKNTMLATNSMQPSAWSRLLK